MIFFRAITFVLLTFTASRGCPTKEKSTVTIEGSGNMDDLPRHLSISADPEEHLPTDDLDSVFGFQLGDSSRKLDRATKQDVYPPRARKIDLDNKSDEDGTDVHADEKRSGNRENDLGLIIGESIKSLSTVSENDRHAESVSKLVPQTVSLLDTVRSLQSTSVPSLPDGQDGLVSSSDYLRHHPPLHPPLPELTAGETTTAPQGIPNHRQSGLSAAPGSGVQNPLPLLSHVHELTAAKPTGPTKSIPDFQQSEVTAPPGFVLQDPSAASILQRLPPELLMYLQTLGASVEEHLLEEFRRIGFSMGPHEDGEEMSHPKYRMICSLGDVEVRSYRRSTWISTTVNTSSFDVATYIGFHRLFRYIRGENSRGTWLDMAKPVRTQVILEQPTEEPRGGEDGRTRYTVSFYASRKRAGDLPTPLDRRIFIEELRPSRFYALTFGGFPISNRVDEHARRLNQLLPNSSRNYSEQLGSSFFTDVYDTPMKLTDRHNEILIPLSINDSPRRWCSNGGPSTE